VSPRFITRVIKAASKAGPVLKGQVSPKRGREGGKLGRGFVQARLARARMGATSRRVTVKMRMVVLARASARSTSTHLRYLEREGVTPEGNAGQAYGATQDEVDLKEFERQGQRDRHQFRFIVSAEDGVELKDLKAFTRHFLWRRWGRTSAPDSSGSPSIIGIRSIPIPTWCCVARPIAAETSSSPGSTSPMACAPGRASSPPSGWVRGLNARSMRARIGR